MSTALCFNDIALTPVTHQNSLWIRAAELARALGYNREDKVAQIYQRNAEEFTSDMTQVIECAAEPQFEVQGNLSAGRARIFSLRGCHLIAMFARTPVAKQFRRWVLDVLDKLAEEERAALAGNVKAIPQTTTPSTPEDRAPLRALVHAWASISNVHHAALWPQVKAHFQLSRIDDLPVEWIPDALAFVQGKIDGHGQQQVLPPAKTKAKSLVERLQLTPWEKMSMGRETLALLDRAGKVGPCTMECILLKLRYLDAIHDVSKLANQLAADLKRVRVGVFGKIVQAGNVTGCITDPVMDILCDDVYTLQKLGDDFHTTAFRALNASICGAKMQGV